MSGLQEVVPSEMLSESNFKVNHLNQLYCKRVTIRSALLTTAPFSGRLHALAYGMIGSISHCLLSLTSNFVVSTPVVQASDCEGYIDFHSAKGQRHNLSRIRLSKCVAYMYCVQDSARKPIVGIRF